MSAANPVIVSTFLAQGDVETTLLDVSHRKDEPRAILLDLQAEVCKLDRYAPVAVRARREFLALLRLLRWDCVYDFQEVTGLEEPRHLRYYWTRSARRFSQ